MTRETNPEFSPWRLFPCLVWATVVTLHCHRLWGWGQVFFFSPSTLPHPLTPPLRSRSLPCTNLHFHTTYIQTALTAQKRREFFRPRLFFPESPFTLIEKTDRSGSLLGRERVETREVQQDSAPASSLRILHKCLVTVSCLNEGKLKVNELNRIACSMITFC